MIGLSEDRLEFGGDVLYIIANRFFLTLFLLDRIDGDPNIVKILHPVSPKGIKYSLAKLYELVFLRLQNSSKFYPQDYISQLKRIRPEDSVLIFGIENIKELIILRRFINSSKISIFTWNPVIDYRQSKILRKIHVNSLKKVASKIYTFDSGDAEKYGLNLINQVYRDISTCIDVDTSEVRDVYFVGQDKGRLSALKEWMGIFECAGLTTYFHIVKEKRVKYEKDDLSLVCDQNIKYEENILEIQKSRCLFELLQENQTGQTVRSLEAAFFQKKLITNNLTIKDTPLYDPDRVFIIGKDRPEDIADFMIRPFNQVSASVLEDYDFKEWVMQFIIK